MQFPCKYTGIDLTQNDYFLLMKLKFTAKLKAASFFLPSQMYWLIWNDSFEIPVITRLIKTDHLVWSSALL